MEEDVDAFESVKRTFERWKDDPKTYLIPSLEVLLELMVLSLSNSFMISFLSVFFLMGAAILAFLSVVLTIIFLIFILVIFLMISFVVIIFRAILDGGMVATMDSIRKKNEYDFLDVLKKGWARKWVHVRVGIALLVFRIIIFTPLFALGFVPFLVLIFITDMGVIGIVMLLVGLLLITILALLYMVLSIFLIPLQFLSHIYAHRERAGGVGSVKRALKWMRGNSKQTFILGGLYFVSVLIGSMIPMLGIFVTSAATLFMYDVLLDLDLSLGKGGKKRARSIDKKKISG